MLQTTGIDSPHSFRLPVKAVPLVAEEVFWVDLWAPLLSYFLGNRVILAACWRSNQANPIQAVVAEVLNYRFPSIPMLIPYLHHLFPPKHLPIGAMHLRFLIKVLHYPRC